jgi:hypothetical protein
MEAAKGNYRQTQPNALFLSVQAHAINKQACISALYRTEAEFKAKPWQVLLWVQHHY